MILTLTVLLVNLNFPSWLPDEFKDETRYRQQPWKGKSGVLFRRTSDQSAVLVRVETYNRLLDFKREDSVLLMPTKTSHLAPSGNSLGTLYELSTGMTGSSTAVVTGSRAEVAYLTIESSRYKVDGKWTSQQRNSAEDAAQLESWARTALSRAASRRLLVLFDTRFADVPVSSSRSLYVGATMIDLDGWAKAKHVDLILSKDRQAVSFIRQGKVYHYTLAGAEYRVDGVSKSMPDIVMQLEGRWFVPANALPG